jgi:hypothetical protein
MNFGEFFIYLIWFAWPIILFEFLRDRYMLNRHKQLMKKVNLLSRENYEDEGRRLTRRGNIFRLLWITWTLFWIIELTLF